MADWFIKNLDSKLYTNKFNDENKQIKLHHIKYRNDVYAPAWKTFEFLIFGAIVTVFNALKSKELKKEIKATKAKISKQEGKLKKLKKKLKKA